MAFEISRTHTLDILTKTRQARHSGVVRLELSSINSCALVDQLAACLLGKAGIAPVTQLEIADHKVQFKVRVPKELANANSQQILEHFGKVFQAAYKRRTEEDDRFIYGRNIDQ